MQINSLSELFSNLSWIFCDGKLSKEYPKWQEVQKDMRLHGHIFCWDFSFIWFSYLFVCKFVQILWTFKIHHSFLHSLKKNSTKYWISKTTSSEHWMYLKFQGTKLKTCQFLSRLIVLFWENLNFTKLTKYGVAACTSNNSSNVAYEYYHNREIKILEIKFSGCSVWMSRQHPPPTRQQDWVIF